MRARARLEPLSKQLVSSALHRPSGGGTQKLEVKSKELKAFAFYFLLSNR
jgi:hypothetical protein